MFWSFWRRPSRVDANLARIEREIGRMDRVTRTVFLMHRLDGLGYPEIAESLGIGVDEVESHIASAMLRLARLPDDALDDRVD
jgi:DNA-directed RNA polymerase specialized sigma24 family protein